MLRRYRHYWILLAATLLSVPLVFGIVVPDNGAVSADELRPLAPMPAFPRRAADWMRLPPEVNAYLGDHFGLRHRLIYAYAVLNQGWLRSGNATVLIGRDGWMFYRGDATLSQSAGIVMRESLVIETADLLATIDKLLASRGVKFIVAPAPNSATIYPDLLPPWARNGGRRTEYDVLLEALAVRGVATTDLRPPLRAARHEGKTYHEHDTHWTMLGAIEGFNATAVAAGHPDWRVAPETVLDAPATIVGGDLARLLGNASDVTETDRGLTLPPGKREALGPEPTPPYLATGDRFGPTVAVFGDSFTAWAFAPLLLLHAGRAAWLPHQGCGFEWKWIDKVRPDEIWWMPTERYMLCVPGVRPILMPAQ